MHIYVHMNVQTQTCIKKEYFKLSNFRWFIICQYNDIYIFDILMTIYVSALYPLSGTGVLV